MRAWLTIVGILISLSASAASTSWEKSLPAYLELQQALAADSLDSAKVGAQKLEKSAPTPVVKTQAHQISQAADIKSARGSFKTMSEKYVAWAEKAKPEGVEIIFCSMAKGKWLQTKGSIRNPYYGKEMLECGER